MFRPQHPTTAQAGPGPTVGDLVRERLELVGLNEVTTLRRILLPEQTDDDSGSADAAVLASAADVLKRYKDHAGPLLLEQPAAAEILVPALGRLHDKVEKLADQTRKTVQQNEADPLPGNPLANIFKGKSSNPIDVFVRLQGDEERRTRARQARRALTIYEAGVALVAEARQWTERIARQRATTGAVVESARSLADQEIANRKQSAALSPLPNDLPADYEPILAGEIAGEAEPIARAQGFRLLSAELGETDEPDQPTEVLAKALYDRIKAASLVPAEFAPQSLQAAVEMVGAALAVDGRAAWRAVLRFLHKSGFAGSPAVALDAIAARDGYVFTFQVFPESCGPVVAPNDPNAQLQVARLVPGSPTTQLGIVRVHTNFPLDAVLPVREIEPELTRAAAHANPFILPGLARAARGQAVEQHADDDGPSPDAEDRTEPPSGPPPSQRGATEEEPGGTESRPGETPPPEPQVHPNGPRPVPVSGQV